MALHDRLQQIGKERAAEKNDQGRQSRIEPDAGPARFLPH
jgi:hypothetical protein